MACPLAPLAPLVPPGSTSVFADLPFIDMCFHPLRESDHFVFY